MAGVLVIKLSALGDLVQADGALRDIREHHHGEELIAMTTPRYRSFMQRCPWVDRVFIDPREPRFRPGSMLELRRRLHTLRVDRVYDLQQVGRTRFYQRWLFPKVEWLGDVRGCAFSLKRPDGACAAEHFARHLNLAGIAVQHTLHPDVSWMADDVGTILADAGLKTGYIVLIPGASAGHQDKRWPYFSELAQRLLAAGRRVVTIPGPDELALCREIPGDTLVAPDGCYDIFTLAGLVKQSSFVVANDTGPGHLAAHCGCRGLLLFGSHASPASTGIQYTGFDWLEAGTLNDLSVEAVWRRLERKLDQQR